MEQLDPESTSSVTTSARNGEGSTLLRERLLPQTSIRFFLLLIALSAGVMYTLRAALLERQTWATVVSMILATACLCFFLYLALFLVASLFSNAVGLLWRETVRQREPKAAEASDTASRDG